MHVWFVSYTIMSNFNFLICTVQQGIVTKYGYINIYIKFSTFETLAPLQSTSFKHLQHFTEVFFYYCFTLLMFEY